MLEKIPSLRAAVVAALALVTGSAGAQCVIEYEATISPGISNNGGVQQILVEGTYQCGVAAGTICGAGISEGTCTASSGASRVVSCPTGQSCSATLGDPGSVSCTGAPDWIGNVDSECYAGSCMSRGTGDFGFLNTLSVVTSTDDPYTNAFACGFGSVTQVHFAGVSALTP